MKLDTLHAVDLARTLIEVLEDGGYSVEESIPALIQATVDLADGDDELLDEAANILADGGVQEEFYEGPDDFGD